MTDALKVLGQVAPGANVLSTLYTVPGGVMTSCSSFTFCNRSSTTSANVRVAVAVAGAADDPKQYVYYDLPIEPNDTFVATVGLSLAAGDVVRVQADTASISFAAYGVEVF